MVSTRQFVAARGIQPRASAMQMSVSPNPIDAIRQIVPGSRPSARAVVVQANSRIGSFPEKIENTDAGVPQKDFVLLWELTPGGVAVRGLMSIQFTHSPVAPVSPGRVLGQTKNPVLAM